MKRALAMFGAGILFIWLCGVVGLIDYKVCVAAKGECAIYIKGERVDQ